MAVGRRFCGAKIARDPGLGKPRADLELSLIMRCKWLIGLVLATTMVQAGPPSDRGDTLLGAVGKLLGALPSASLSHRTAAASRALLGRPYLLGPLGEGDTLLGEGKPRLRLDSFDCVTYLETSLALAMSRDSTEVLGHMDSVRYRQGNVAWRERNHFMESEWLVRNAAHHRLLRLPGDTVVQRRLARAEFYRKRGYVVSDTVVNLPVLWRERAVQRFAKPADSTKLLAVGFLGKVEGYPLLHVGFLDLQAGKIPVLRHASQAGTVREQPLWAYLEEKKKFQAVLVWEIVP